MAWLREWMWKITILALPWQTRWIWHISQTPEAGYQTEWGIYAVYGSWLLILATWAVSLGVKAEKIRIKKTIWIAGCLMFIPMIVHPTWYMWQWMAQWFIILLFADALRRLRLKREQVIGWFLWSVMPHVGLAFLQMFEQSVRASTWLGMAAQNPLISGVSVIGSSRFLRAYAGFPHPNIAGMWFVFGLAAALWRVSSYKQQSHAKLTCVMLGLLSSGLVFTFSRTAWLSASVLLWICFIGIRSQTEAKRRYWPIALVILCVFLTALPLRSKIMARVSPVTHLEQRSTNERVQAWKEIWPIIRVSPFTGYGIGRAAPLMQAGSLGNQPPHALPMIVMLELGVFGFLGLILIIGTIWMIGDQSTNILLTLLFIPSLTDHYLWSLWSGQMLIGLLIMWWTIGVTGVDIPAKI